MNKFAIVIAATVVALIGATIYLHTENRRLEAEVLRLDEAVDRMLADDAQLRDQIHAMESQLAATAAAATATGAPCDRVFPSGLYRLVTNTNYGAGSGETTRSTT